jgi:ABC-type hemin transport system ATPase subunit
MPCDDALRTKRAWLPLAAGPFQATILKVDRTVYSASTGQKSAFHQHTNRWKAWSNEMVRQVLTQPSHVAFVQEGP